MKKKQKAEVRTLAARIPIELRRRLKRAAADEDISVQEFLRRAVEQYVSQLEYKHKRR